MQAKDTGSLPLTVLTVVGSILGSLVTETVCLILVLAFKATAALVKSAIAVLEAMASGWNPVAGRDVAGTRPPFAPLGGPTLAPGDAFIPQPGSPPGYVLYGNLFLYADCGGLAHACNLTGTTPAFVAAAAPYAYYPYTYPNGFFVRQPQPGPAVDTHMPAANMTNTSGGVGCEPGYNYFFPSEHTKCHVFHSKTPPWQLPAGAQVPFKAAHIPCTVTLGELLKGFGCTSSSPKQNRCYEIVPGGNGAWYKGINFSGGDKDMLKKTMKDVGWDKSRSGNPGEKPVVCLWFCKG